MSSSADPAWGCLVLFVSCCQRQNRCSPPEAGQECMEKKWGLQSPWWAPSLTQTLTCASSSVVHLSQPQKATSSKSYQDSKWGRRPWKVVSVQDVDEAPPSEAPKGATGPGGRREGVCLAGWGVSRQPQTHRGDCMKMYSNILRSREHQKEEPRMVAPPTGELRQESRNCSGRRHRRSSSSRRPRQRLFQHPLRIASKWAPTCTGDMVLFINGFPFHIKFVGC